jgi:hypothetical protein
MNQNFSILLSLLHFITKTKSLKSFEVHHETKPKYIHLIVASIIDLNFQF